MAAKEIASHGQRIVKYSEQRDFECEKNKKSQSEHLNMVGYYESKICSMEKDIEAYIDRMNALNRVITDMRVIGE